MLAYGTGTQHMPRNFLLPALLTATAISVFVTPFAGHLLDRFGRKRKYMLSAVLTGVLICAVTSLVSTARLHDYPNRDPR